LLRDFFLAAFLAVFFFAVFFFLETFFLAVFFFDSASGFFSTLLPSDLLRLSEVFLPADFLPLRTVASLRLA
jgi:hypothetical protein